MLRLSSDEDMSGFKLAFKSADVAGAGDIPDFHANSKRHSMFGSSGIREPSMLTSGSPSHSLTIDRIPAQVTQLVDEVIDQLKSITLPHDKSQQAFLQSLEDERVQSTRLVSLLNFLLQKVAATSLETSKMFREQQQAREELRISENRASRLLLHLQQNVKLLARVATGEGETTIVQEAAQNLASVGSGEISVSSDYLKQMKRALESGTDKLAGIEVLELLKQEISINAIMRKQTERLFETSKKLSVAVQQLRKDVAARKAEPMDRGAREKLAQREKLINEIAEVTGLQQESLAEGVAQIVRENATSKRTSELLRKKCLAMQQELAAAQNSAKEEQAKNEEREEKIRKARMDLMEVLGIRCKAASEADALSFGVARALPFVNQSKDVARMLGVDATGIVDAVKKLVMENEELRQENVRAKAAKEQASDRYKWVDAVSGSALEMENHDSGIDEAALGRLPSIDTGSMADESAATDAGSEEHINQISHLQDQFTAIERELEEIQRQMSQQTH